MPKLSELRRKERTITVHWKVEENVTVPIQVTYDPSKITMASQDPKDDQTLIDYYRTKLLEYVRGWDIMDESGNGVPITIEGINSLERALVEQMIVAIQDDARPNP